LALSSIQNQPAESVVCVQLTREREKKTMSTKDFVTLIFTTAARLDIINFHNIFLENIIDLGSKNLIGLLDR
jgi:hypothetical protein